MIDYTYFSGYWLFHCHIEFHAEIGMALIFKVGENEEMPPVPHNFPKCGDWKLTDDQNEDNSEITTISTTIDKEESKEHNQLMDKIDHLLRYMMYLEQLLKLQTKSSASNSSITLLLFVVCILSSVIRACSL